MNNINKYIDHTFLKTNTTKRQIISLCEQAIKYNFASVCINPCFVQTAKKLLHNTSIDICTVIGFPLGQNTTSIKLKETEDAFSNGANEIDVVMNVGKLIEKDFPYVENELKKIKEIAKQRIVKVIIETCLLNDENKQKACDLIIKSGCDYVKTSTGVIPYSKATLHDVDLLVKYVDGKIKVKASGGISNYETAMSFINAGAARIGTSKSINIVEEK